MRATLFILLSILTFELILGATFFHRQENPPLTSEPPSSLFNLMPPQPAKAIKEALAYQTVPLSYPSQEIILEVKGDMILTPVDKTYALPSWYVPPSLVSLGGQMRTIGPEMLRKRIVPDLKNLFTAAEKACGCKLAVLSAYRSYQTQVAVYNYWVSKVGWYYADLGSARPGHSEHQLGTTVDLTSSTIGYQLTRNFGYTKEGVWLEENSYKYGFVLSYPKGKDKITGYIWEPWHLRWVGKEVAKAIHNKRLTPTEYLR